MRESHSHPPAPARQRRRQAPHHVHNRAPRNPPSSASSAVNRVRSNEVAAILPDVCLLPARRMRGSSAGSGAVARPSSVGSLHQRPSAFQQGAPSRPAPSPRRSHRSGTRQVLKLLIVYATMPRTGRSSRSQHHAKPFWPIHAMQPCTDMSRPNFAPLIHPTLGTARRPRPTCHRSVL